MVWHSEIVGRDLPCPEEQRVKLIASVALRFEKQIELLRLELPNICDSSTSQPPQRQRPFAILLCAIS